MRRRRARGKKVTGLEVAFMIPQMFAVIFLIAIVFQHLSAKTTFEEGVEYLPVIVTYEKVDAYTVRDSDGDLETKYDCMYSYVVDGKRYEKEETKSVRISEGTQMEKYYNPNNPSKISGYRSASEMLEGLKTVWILFGVLQAVAVVFLVLLLRKKLTRHIQSRQYEEQVRYDIERNVEQYKNIDIKVNRSVAQEILEALRLKAYKSQKRFETYEKWGNVAVGGNPFIAIAYVVLRMIAQIFINKAKNRMLADRAEFDKEYKRLIAEPILNNLFDDYTYRPSQGFSGAQLTSFKLYKESLQYATTEDMIEGTYKGVHYCQSDVKREHRSNESKEFAHNGRVCVYDFNKKLDGEILIANKDNTNIVSFGMQKVSMESMAFNNAFQVYASDPHIAYYILTPQFMEYMLALNIRGEFAMRIFENNIFVLRNHINGIFEADMKRPLDIDFEIGKSYVELKEILDFIDVMNLEGVVTEPQSDFGRTEPQVVETNENEPSLFAEPDYNRTSKSSLQLKIPTK